MTATRHLLSLIGAAVSFLAIAASPASAQQLARPSHVSSDVVQAIQESGFAQAPAAPAGGIGFGFGDAGIGLLVGVGVTLFARSKPRKPASTLAGACSTPSPTSSRTPSATSAAAARSTRRRSPAPCARSGSHCSRRTSTSRS